MEKTYYEIGLIRRERPPLDADTTVDAVVIGGGFAGIGAAKTFVEAGFETLVIERGTVGCLASGRNGGGVGGGDGGHLENRDYSAASADLAYSRGAREMLEMLAEHNLDLPISRGGFMLALNRRQIASMQRMVDLSRGSQFLDETTLKGYVRTERFRGALRETDGDDGFNANPHQLIEYLAQVVEMEGVRIVEHTNALSVADADGAVVVRTDHGTVRADRLVVAAGAALSELYPPARSRIAVVQSQIGVTEPIPELLDQVLIRDGDMLFCEAGTLARYFRRLEDGRLMFGTSSVLKPVADSELRSYVGRQMVDTFPQLSDVKLEYAWTGEIGSTPNEKPWMRRIGRRSVLTISNGVGASWIGGKVAAKATSEDYLLYERMTAGGKAHWPPLGLPMPLVRTVGTAYLRLKDRFF